MSNNSRRLSILSAKEVDDLCGLPHFTEEQRHLYFDLSTAEHQVVEKVRTVSVAVHLTLQLGYFKAKRQFFSYQQDAVIEDLNYILKQNFSGQRLASINLPSKPTRLEQHQIILQLFNYRLCDSDAKVELESKARRVAMLSIQPVYILRELIQHLTGQRVVAPSYRFLQEMIGRVVTGERTRITKLLTKALTPTVESQLKILLEAEEGVYGINLLKHEPKDFSYKELRREVDRRKYFQPLHEFAQTFLATTGISNESGKYYAGLVKFYTAYKLRRMSVTIVRLYLLCFAYHRFRQINDNLIEAFIHLVNQYEKQAKLGAEQAMQKALTDAANNLQAAGQVLNLFMDESIAEDLPFSVVKTKAFSILDPASFLAVSDYMRNIKFDKTGFEWLAYSKLSATFKRNLRQLFTDLTFASRVENAPLLAAVVFLQTLLQQGKSPRQTDPTTFPVAVIPKNLHRYLYTIATADGKEKILEIDRYEFLIYRLLRNALSSGDLFVRDSNEFRCFEDDLISDERWRHKNEVLQEIGAPILLTPIQQTLAAFEQALETKFKVVNQRITDGLNQHIKVRGAADKSRWKLIYPSAEEPVNSPFYSQLPGIGIADLLWFVAANTGFLSTFTHVLDRYVKQDPDPSEILACIVGMGTNMGLGRMAEVSGLSHSSMMTTARNYLRLETLHAANDAITNAIATLPAFHLYDIQDVIHSSSDGQRMETQIDTINARYSPKYFGLQKGVSSYTLVANHVPINAKIIGTHEHESHYVFDLLHNNTSDIKPERHSTDTHGTNQVNFWILHAFGYHFAPRYRDLHKKMGALVGAKHPSEYSDFLIKPVRKIYRELIEQEWPNIQRIMASLAQKDVTQATIVRKLASYERQNQTKKALWELENICRTLYILDFIDDVTLRQTVQKALNRGEAYHRFRRAVAYVNGGKFRVKTEGEQQIWNECSRLISNAVIYYNTLLLSRVYEQKQAADDQEALAIIKDISPVAWQHINLFGTFEFSPSTSKVDIDALVVRYADPTYWHQAIQAEAESNLD
jgi:TnpA family transposase